MSAALATPPQSRRSAPELVPQVNSRPRPQQLRHLTEVRVLLQPHPSWPLWLKSLVVVQWCSSGAALVILISLLPLYGLAAWHQYQWGQTYKNLQNLEQQERELHIAHQAHRHQVAERIERQPQGLIPQTPKQVLFVPQPTPADVPTPTQAGSHPPQITTPTVSY